MSPAATPLLPPRRSLAAWAALAAVLIVGFYALTLALAAACAYLPYLMLSGHFGVVTVFFAGGVVMAGTILWSLVPRREKFTPPGPRLEAARHPRLFAEIQRLAKTFNEPPPQEVYLIAGVNAWVSEPEGRGRRIMGLGLPLLQVLTVSRFRAVLAHEFAHYYGGDTRLGPWVYKTRVTMVRTLRGLGAPSAVLKFLTRVAPIRLAHFVVTSLLLAYWNLFLRITQLISRRQELRADELACAAAGSRALREGLQDIHRAAAITDAYWGQLGMVLSAGYRPPIAEGFACFMAAGSVRVAVAAHLAKELSHPQKRPYDSHPPLRERLEAAGRLPAGNESADDHPATSLLEDITGMEAQLLEKLNPKLNVSSLKLARWEELGETIYVPGWRKFVGQYAALLAGATAGSLPEKTKTAAEMGSRMRDAKGLILKPQQRVQRARDLLATSLSLALMASGWELHAQPGDLYFQRGDEKFQPFRAVHELATAKITGAAWLERAKALGIEHLSLEPKTAPPEAAGPTA